MCLLKNNNIQTNAINAIIIGGILSVIFALLLIFRYYNYIPESYNDTIDPNITSSVGSLLGGILAPLWSGIAVYVYFLALRVQAKELAISQEGIFAQNLNQLIERSSDIKNKLTIKVRKQEFISNDAILFFYISLKYCYRIIAMEKISPIMDWDVYEELKNYEKENLSQEEMDIEKYELEQMAKTNYDFFKKFRKECHFNSYIPFFVCLFQLSNENLKWKQDVENEFNHIVETFKIVGSKYVDTLLLYFKYIELSIKYICQQDYEIKKKREYGLWISSLIQPSGLAFFYYYIYSQNNKELIKCCKELDFFERIEKEKLLFDEAHYGLINNK